MAEFPALPLWTDAYLADTCDLNDDEHGVYLVMMMIAWRRPDCSLPGDKAMLKRLLGGAIANLHGNRFNRIVPPLLDRFWHRNEAGDWVQKRLCRERQYVQDYRRKQADRRRGKTGIRPEKSEKSPRKVREKSQKSFRKNADHTENALQQSNEINTLKNPRLNHGSTADRPPTPTPTPTPISKESNDHTPSPSSPLRGDHFFDSSEGEVSQPEPLSIPNLPTIENVLRASGLDPRRANAMRCKWLRAVPASKLEAVARSCLVAKPHNPIAWICAEVDRTAAFQRALDTLRAEETDQ